MEKVYENLKEDGRLAIIPKGVARVIETARKKYYNKMGHPPTEIRLLQTIMGDLHQLDADEFTWIRDNLVQFTVAIQESYQINYQVIPHKEAMQALMAGKYIYVDGYYYRFAEQLLQRKESDDPWLLSSTNLLVKRDSQFQLVE